MTINVGGTFFLKAGSICRVALMAGLVGALLPAGGCTSTSPGSSTPVGLTQAPQDTGSYPNLNIPPKVANKQFTLIVAHRLSSLMHADQILFIDPMLSEHISGCSRRG